jgi:hypothetical protein
VSTVIAYTGEVVAETPCVACSIVVQFRTITDGLNAERTGDVGIHLKRLFSLSNVASQSIQYRHRCGVCRTPIKRIDKSGRFAGDCQQITRATLQCIDGYLVASYVQRRLQSYRLLQVLCVRRCPLQSKPFRSSNLRRECSPAPLLSVMWCFHTTQRTRVVMIEVVDACPVYRD